MTLYLIAHKVRGEPAFDIAEPMSMADGTWWIIPTSGHRAYPYWHCPLGEWAVIEQVGDPPQGLRDHYQITEPPRSGSSQAPATRSVRPQTPAPRPEDL